MRVGLDVTPAVTARAGLARYTEELWRELERRDDVEVHAFALGRGRDDDFGLPLTRRHLPLRALRPLWRVIRWPRAETFAGDVDVVHTVALTPIPTTFCRSHIRSCIRREPTAGSARSSRRHGGRASS